MLDLSTEFKNEMFNDNRDFLPFLDITLKDGTVLNLTKEDVWQNSFKVEDATSASNKFTIGAAVTGKLSVTLNNIYDKFSEYDFADAVVIAYVGLQLSKTLEKVRVGTYIVDDPSYDGSTISLSCIDYMSKFDKPYANSSLQYPATLSAILNDACTKCGVSLLSSNFPNYTYTVASRPKDDAMTFGDIVAMVTQLAGCWAKMDVYGRLKLGWYEMSIFEQNNGLDGGTFSTSTKPYSDGDTADGGNFTDYSSGDSVDGGTFADQVKFHHIYSTKSFSVSTDDVVITGVKVTEEFEETEKEKKGTYLAGSEGYVIDISGNALIQKGQAHTVANYLYSRVGGMRFRPLSVETLANPSIESGDIAYVTDRKQNTYQSFISNRTFALGGSENIVCDAETPSRNNSKRFSEMTKAVVKARNETKKQISTYDIAVQQLTNLMTQSFGVFKSEEILDDGSVIYYMHDKPERANSSTIWKMTADAFAVSTDGGKTWNAGFDSSGNAVVNVLNAIGINADWINAGTITGRKINNGNGTFTVDESGNCIANKLTANGATLSGTFEQYSSSGVKSLDIKNNKVDFYAWNDDGNYVGSIGAVKKTSEDRVGVQVWCDAGDYLSLGCRSRDDVTIVENVIKIDENTYKESTPWIRNTANGKLFPDNGDGITIENGLIKGFNIFTATGSVSFISGIVITSGAITSVTRTTLEIKNGLIVSWSSETTS